LSVKAEAGGNAALVMVNEDDGLHATVKIDESGSENRVTVAFGEKKRTP
jgi:hypothetical protein